MNYHLDQTSDLNKKKTTHQCRLGRSRVKRTLQTTTRSTTRAGIWTRRYVAGCTRTMGSRVGPSFSFWEMLFSFQLEHHIRLGLRLCKSEFNQNHTLDAEALIYSIWFSRCTTCTAVLRLRRTLCLLNT